MIERPPNGLGDLTGAVFLARLLAGQPAAKALQSTTAAVFEILARTAKRGADELTLETDAQSLSHPMAMVHLRHLTHPGGTAGRDGAAHGRRRRRLQRRLDRRLRARPGDFHVGVFARFADLVDRLPADAAIAVDMPIGLPERNGPWRARTGGAGQALPRAAAVERLLHPRPRRRLCRAGRGVHFAGTLVRGAPAGECRRARHLRAATRRLHPGLRHLPQDPRDSTARCCASGPACATGSSNRIPEVAFWRLTGAGRWRLAEEGEGPRQSAGHGGAQGAARCPWPRQRLPRPCSAAGCGGRRLPRRRGDDACRRALRPRRGDELPRSAGARRSRLADRHLDLTAAREKSLIGAPECR